MKKMLLLLCLMIITFSCSHTKFITVSSTPPSVYEIKNASSTKGLIEEYKRSVMKIAEWQKWYNTEIGSNYYKVYENIK